MKIGAFGQFCLVNTSGWDTFLTSVEQDVTAGEAASAARRDTPGDFIGFNFDSPPPLQEGKNSALLIVRSNAKSWRRDVRSVLNSEVAMFGVLVAGGDTATVPSITLQPSSQVVKAGASVTFNVEAQGSPPLSYQWRKNGIDIGGATSAHLALGNVQPIDSGDYSVLVANVYGSVMSSLARLTVFLPPATPKPPPPTATPSTAPPPSNLPEKPRVPSDKNLIVLSGGGLVHRDKMTIVLTHGFLSSSSEWPTKDGC
jgi:hypothetical protein